MRPLLSALVPAAVLCWSFLATPAWSAPPPAPAPTAEEAAALARGEVTVRVLEDGGTMAMVEVAASPERTLAAVLDFQARVGDIGSLHEAQVYLDEPTRKGVRWQLRIAGVSVTFHTLYQVDPAGRWTSFVLDTSRDNDIDDTQGIYQVVDLGGGRSRLVYTTRASSEAKAPGWVRRMLQQKATRSLLAGMRDRAQG